MNKPINFKLANLLKEKGFQGGASYFYAKPKSKVFGIDEHGRHYPIKNTANTLYVVGNAAVLNGNNAYYAPTVAEVLMWLYEKHDIYIHLSPHGDDETLFKDCKWWFSIYKERLYNLMGGSKVSVGIEDFNSPTEAYESAIEYALTNLIK